MAFRLGGNEKQRRSGHSEQRHRADVDAADCADNWPIVNRPLTCESHRLHHQQSARDTDVGAQPHNAFTTAPQRAPPVAKYHLRYIQELVNALEDVNDSVTNTKQRQPILSTSTPTSEANEHFQFQPQFGLWPFPGHAPSEVRSCGARQDTFPRGRTIPTGSCPWPCPWAWPHGAHLLT